MMQQVSTSGSSTLMGWKRRVSAGILFDILAVLGPGGRGDGAQGAAGERRFQQVGGVAGADRAAGADQGVGFVDKKDDRGRRALHLVDDRSQPLLEFSLHRRTGLHQADVERAEPHAFQRRRNLAGCDPLREAFDDRGLADAGLAGEDRVVLAPAHQDVDQLAYLVVTAKDRIHLAGFRLRGQILREPVERGGALCVTGGCAAPGVVPQFPSPSIGRRVSSSEAAQILRYSAVRTSIDILLNSGERFFSARSSSRDCHRPDQNVTGPDLRFAEEQGRVVPAAVEQVHHRVGNGRISVSFLRNPAIAALTSIRSLLRSSLK